MEKKVACALILILTLLAPLVARGNPEVGLPKVDRLIKERNYNAAIMELAEYMTETPEDFDGAQRRVRRIINMREDYNDLGLALLGVLTNEPTNDKKKLDMITYLESLEKNPNPSTQAFIAEIKSAAQFTYYRAKFDEIMNDGNSLIDQGLYVEAARKFSEGYTFYKTEFDEENPEQLVSDVNARLARVSSLLDSYALIQESLSTLSTASQTALATGDHAVALVSLKGLEGELASLARLRNTVAEQGWFFSDTFDASNGKNAQTTDNSFLPFAWRFTLGRKTIGRFEGVLGAMDAQWDKTLSGVEEATEQTVWRNWQSAYEHLGSGNVEAARANLFEARRFASLARSFPAVSDQLQRRADTWGMRDPAVPRTRYTSVDTLISAMGELGDIYTRFLALQDRLSSDAPPPPDGPALRTSPTQGVRLLQTRVGELESIASVVNATAEEVSRLPDVPLYTQDYIKRRNELVSSLDGIRLSLYRGIAANQDESSSLLAQEWIERHDEANRLLDGVTDEDSSTVRYYPAESLALFTEVRRGVTADIAVIQRLQSAMTASPPAILADQDYASRLASVAAVRSRLEALANDASAGITRANSRVLQANLAKQESDLRFRQAQDALRRSDFQLARDNLQRSRERINQSLSIQESASIRTESDIRLSNLGAEITRIENESVVREVRALISSGKNLYYLGNFDQAEQLLIQARNRWGVTNIEPNAEVNNWLDIINTALSMKTGRTIPVSAPLYPQMSQILSSANQLYSEGRTLMSVGKRTEAISALTSARSQLQQLQLVYPLNQDAGTLSLKIDQVIDPDAFKEFFSQKVDYIRANYRSERQTAYSDLLDLYLINPGYPGLSRLVEEVEIYLGIRLPPPDPRSLSRSRELTQSAQRIYDANTRSMFQVALNQLDEAIKLNPENQSAIVLKDRVQTAIGGGAVAVLSAVDEAKYQQAVQELQKGNKITASALVEQLLQNPKSRNATKIIDLKKRIDSQL